MECLPVPNENVVKTNYESKTLHEAINARLINVTTAFDKLVESARSIEKSIKQLINVSDIAGISESDDYMENDSNYSINDIVTVEKTNETEQWNISSIEKVPKECHIREGCHKAWKRLFAKCGCQ